MDKKLGLGREGVKSGGVGVKGFATRGTGHAWRDTEEDAPPKWVDACESFVILLES
jgi:hypothetical protein